MAMQEWEMRQIEKGNVAGAEIARPLREQFGDVPLPTITAPKTAETPIFEEASKEIQRFSAEQREALEARGMTIVELTGQSIKTLRDGGKKFWSTWHQDHPQFEAATSRLSEVAIIPELFIPNSNNKTLAEQEEMVAEMSKGFAQINGVKAIIGEVSDYSELAFSHLASTGSRLFGENFGYKYTRTNTPTTSGGVAYVGRFDAQDGLLVHGWHRDARHDRLFVAPLVVPVGNR